LAETAALLYRNFENKNEAKGKSITSIAAATIYLACKRRSVIRSLDEIVNATTGTHRYRSNRKLAKQNLVNSDESEATQHRFLTQYRIQFQPPTFQ
jgi:transcription initiation factor TFIIIB Brf1 subunit/transcription initiation factor TFIIB